MMTTRYFCDRCKQEIDPQAGPAAPFIICGDRETGRERSLDIVCRDCEKSFYEWAAGEGEETI